MKLWNTLSIGACLLALGVSCVSFYLASRPYRFTQGRAVVSELQIRADGVSPSSVSVSPHQILMRGEDGNPAIELSVQNGTTSILMHGRYKPLVRLTASADGAPAFELFGGDGKTLLSFTVEKERGGRIAVCNLDGKELATIGIPDGKNGAFVAKSVTEGMVSQLDHRGISGTDRYQKPAFFAGVDENAQPKVVFFDGNKQDMFLGRIPGLGIGFKALSPNGTEALTLQASKTGGEIVVHNAEGGRAIVCDVEQNGKGRVNVVREKSEKKVDGGTDQN